MIIIGSERHEAHVPIVTIRDDQTEADAGIGLKLGWHLKRLYPGHAWLVEATARQGVAVVKHAGLCNRFPAYRNFGYVIPLRDLSTDSAIEADAMQAGGQLLEYFNVARKRFTTLDDSKPAFATMKQFKAA